MSFGGREALTPRQKTFSRLRAAQHHDIRALRCVNRTKQSPHFQLKSPQTAMKRIFMLPNKKTLFQPCAVVLQWDADAVFNKEEQKKTSEILDGFHFDSFFCFSVKMRGKTTFESNRTSTRL